MWNLNYDTNELIYKTETDLQTQKANFCLAKGRGGGRESQEFGINRRPLLYIKQINKDLPCRTGDHIQYSVISHKGKDCD